MLKKILKTFIIIILVIILSFVIFLGISTIFEYRPADIETLAVIDGTGKSIDAGSSITIVTFNIGYGGLSADQDFFMDGGTMVRPNDKSTISNNMAGIINFVAETKADVYLIQEADVKSKRSYHVNQVEMLQNKTQMNAAFAYNFNSLYTPYPIPPIGKVESGLLTLTNLEVSEAKRISLPVPFSWPVSIFNLKRCLLVERIPAGNRELVLVNLHLEAYDDGEGKKEQFAVLMNLLKDEYEKGNYVIAGGDFNKIFPDSAYPDVSTEFWEPGTLTEDLLPDGFRYAYDAQTPTCRLLNKPFSGNYEDTQLYVIDGFILSPNVTLDDVRTIDMAFAYSDHHPVLLQVTLQ